MNAKILVSAGIHHVYTEGHAQKTVMVTPVHVYLDSAGSIVKLVCLSLKCHNKTIKYQHLLVIRLL